MMAAKQRWLACYVSEEAARLLLSSVQNSVDMYPDQPTAEEIKGLSAEEAEALKNRPEPSVRDCMAQFREPFSLALDKMVRDYATRGGADVVPVRLAGRHLEILDWIAGAQGETRARVLETILRQALSGYLPMFRDWKNGEAKTLPRDVFNQRHASE